MVSVEVILVKRIGDFPAWDSSLLYDSNCICLCCHDNHRFALYAIFFMLARGNYSVNPGYPKENQFGGDTMDHTNNPESREQDRQQIIELGADVTKGKNGKIYTLTIIGQVEGHQVLPETCKTTKYEHVLPILAHAENSKDVAGLLLLENTIGGDCSAGLAIAELIASMTKPTVSLVLGGSHSIGVPLAVSARCSLIAPSAAMTVHPVRASGMIISAPQMFRYFQRVQNRITNFVTENSGIKRKDFIRLMMNTDELAADIGSVVDGEQAVELGLIDRIGGLSDAMEQLHRMIENRQSGEGKR